MFYFSRGELERDRRMVPRWYPMNLGADAGMDAPRERGSHGQWESEAMTEKHDGVGNEREIVVDSARHIPCRQRKSIIAGRTIRASAPPYRWVCPCQEPPVLLATYDPAGRLNIKVRDRYWHLFGFGHVQAICPRCGAEHLLDLRALKKQTQEDPSGKEIMVG
jgi:hypothetical protein